MATLNELRGEMLTSVHGRRLGIDVNEFLIGTKGHRQGITAATSATTGTALPNYGLVTIDSTTGDTYTLSDPVEGCEVEIVGICTGGTNTINGNNATFMSCASSTSGSIQIVGPGGIHLVGLTTGLWGVVATRGSSAVTHVNT